MTARASQPLPSSLSSLIELPEPEKIARGVLYTPAEIAQQPATWEGTYSRVYGRREELRNFLSPILPATRRSTRTVYLVGAGTSDYIGRALTSLLRQKWQCEVLAVPSTELITNMENYVLPEREYLWISFSRSGDSSEGVGVLESALERYPQVRHLVITCNHRGKMASLCSGREKAFVLLLDDAVNDRGLAMTSSFTNMVIAGQCLANIDDLDGYRSIVKSLIEMGKHALANAGSVAEELAGLHCPKACFVGSGALAAAATECGLKVMELTAGSVYAMAESTMGLRHGPMSALDDNTMFAAFVSGNERRRRYEVDLLTEIHDKKLGRVRVAVAPRETDELRRVCTNVIALDAPAEFPDDYRVPADVIFGQLYGLFSSLGAGLRPDEPSPRGTITRVVSHLKIYR